MPASLARSARFAPGTSPAPRAWSSHGSWHTQYLPPWERETASNAVLVFYQKNFSTVLLPVLVLVKCSPKAHSSMESFIMNVDYNIKVVNPRHACSGTVCNRSCHLLSIYCINFPFAFLALFSGRSPQCSVFWEFPVRRMHSGMSLLLSYPRLRSGSIPY